MRFAQSVRARLAFGHTMALATLLFLSAGATYVLLARTMAERTDQYLAETADAFQIALAAEYAEDPSVRVAVTQALDAFRFGDLTFVVFDSAWNVVASTLASEPSRPARTRYDHHGERLSALDLGRLRASVSESQPLGEGERFVTLHDSEGGFRAHTLPVRLGTTFLTAVTVHSLHDQMETLESVRGWYLVAIPVVLVLAWIGGYLLARHSLRPTESMSRSAERISAANLTERLPVGDPRDELGHLATVINALLGRVQDAFEQQRRFTADASHELRTPITILQNEADIALARSERDPSEYRETISLMRTTTKRMATIVDDLFLLARADSGEQPLRVSHFYLEEMIEECVRSTRAIAAQRGTSIRCETESGAECIGDESLLRRVILNLLDNAIKYSPPGSAVDISLLQSGARPGSGGQVSPGGQTGPGVQTGAADAGAHEASGVYMVSVTDNGPGIPVADQPRIFDRFYRVDSARTRSFTELSVPQSGAATSEPSGAGLGLAISRWVAEAHGGELYLENSTPDGTRFVLVLPRAATSSSG